MLRPSEGTHANKSSNEQSAEFRYKEAEREDGEGGVEELEEEAEEEKARRREDRRIEGACVQHHFLVPSFNKFLCIFLHLIAK